MKGLKLTMLNRLLKSKKKSNIMISEEELISYKQNFTGQRFQWIKTDDISLLGKVVKCRDVDIIGGRIKAIFDDGSKIDASLVTESLLMIHGEMQPLSREEVQSIYKPKNVAQKENLPIQNKLSDKKPPPQKSDVNPFEMFNSDVTSLSIRLDIKLPDKKLLKMMYNNAENKEEFLKQLSSYVSSQINNKVVNDSLQKMLDPNPVKSNIGTGTGVKLTETKNE